MTYGYGLDTVIFLYQCVIGLILMYGCLMSKCERKRCRHEARPGSRWCQGHSYLGESYDPKAKSENRQNQLPEVKRSLLDSIKQMFKG